MKPKTSTLAMLWSTVLCMSACTLPGRQALADRELTAEENGVRVVLETGKWSDNPPNLVEYFTPVRVTLENASAHPLRVSYADLVLRGPVFDYEPLPPRRLVKQDVEIEDPEPVLVPRFEHSEFWIARHYYPSFSELRPWDTPWDLDSPWYERQFVRWRGTLPTVDMIELALPEGVLEPGGRLSGYLYFERPREPLRELTFEADLVDARTALSFGQVRMPL